MFEFDWYLYLGYIAIFLMFSSFGYNIHKGTTSVWWFVLWLLAIPFVCLSKGITYISVDKIDYAKVSVKGTCEVNAKLKIVDGKIKNQIEVVSGECVPVKEVAK